MFLKYIKLCFITSTALFALSSCEKDSDVDNYNPLNVDTDVFSITSFSAVFDDDNANSLKTYQIGCAEHGMHNNWSGNEEIDVISVPPTGNSGKPTGNASFILSDFQNEVAKFKLQNNAKPLDAKSGGYALAAYNGTFNSTLTMSFEIPSFQIYADRIENIMPMIAKSGQFKSDKKWSEKDSLTLSFVNLASMFRFDVNPDSSNLSKKVTDIIVSGDNICGKGTVSYSESTPIVTMENKSNAEISLKCNNAQPIGGVLSYAMIVAPLNGTQLNIRIKVDDNGTTKTITKSGKVTIERSKFKKLTIDLAKDQYDN